MKIVPLLVAVLLTLGSVSGQSGCTSKTTLLGEGDQVRQISLSVEGEYANLQGGDGLRSVLLSADLLRTEPPAVDEFGRPISAYFHISESDLAAAAQTLDEMDWIDVNKQAWGESATTNLFVTAVVRPGEPEQRVQCWSRTEWNDEGRMLVRKAANALTLEEAAAALNRLSQVTAIDDK